MVPYLLNINKMLQYLYGFIKIILQVSIYKIYLDFTYE